MSDKRVIKIDGVQIKNPKDFNIERYNLTKSGRVTSGIMTMDLVAKKRKFNLTYEVISGKHLNEILNLIDTDKMFFQLEYPDINGVQSTCTVYAGAIPSDYYRYGKLTGEYWKNVSFSLIQQ